MLPLNSFFDELQKVAEQNKAGGLREGLKVLLTGRMPVFHGTSAARGAKILKEGLKPQGASGISQKVTEALTPAMSRGDIPLAQAEKGLAFTTLNPTEAATFAAQQAGMDRFVRGQGLLSNLLGRGTSLPGKLGLGAHKAQEAVASASPVHPFTRPITSFLGALPGGKRVVRADIPRKSLHQAEGIGQELHVTPSMKMTRELLREKHPLLEQLPAVGFMSHVPLRGGVPTQYIRGAKGYQGVSLDEIRRHAGEIMRNPMGVGKDVLRSTFGVAHRPSTLLQQGVGIPQAV